ncbi:hypothetical protein EMCRGX_G004489 [Ephydatia muelleri]
MQEHLSHPDGKETLVLDVHIYGIPHHLVMLPPMMNMEFYDIDIVMAMQLPHYRLHKTFVLTYKSTKTRQVGDIPNNQPFTVSNGDAEHDNGAALGEGCDHVALVYQEEVMSTYYSER